MYEIEIHRVFHASHALRLPGGLIEESHAHDWQTYVVVTCQELDEVQCVMDFHELEPIVDKVLGAYDHRNLNEVEPFVAKWNPSAERIAEAIFKSIAPQLPSRVKLQRVTVTEAEGCRASYLGE